MLTLPTDLILPVFEHCDIGSLCSLSQTCRRMNILLEIHGYPDYLRRNPRPAYSLPSTWSCLAQIKYNACTDTAWDRQKLTARPLRDPWIGKLQPVMAINQTRLLIGAGETLYSYTFGEDANTIAFEGQLHLSVDGDVERAPPFPDISALEFITENTFFIGFADGSLERADILPADRGSLCLRRLPLGAATRHQGDFIESICHASDGSTLLLSSSGLVSLICGEQQTSVSLDRRSWTSLLQLDASTPFAVFGSSSTSTPLTVHTLHSGISATPSIALYANTAQLESASYMGTASAVYALCRSPPCAPWGASEQVIISGWYDGRIRVYDLRSSLRARAQESNPTRLLPSLSFSDPWSPEPIYALSSGGGSGANVCAGTARHSVVSFWDLRYVQPTQASPNEMGRRDFGWSVHAPMNDPSPIYSLIMESSRVWGATQSRPFVLDFGSDVGPHTYPALETKPTLRNSELHWRGRGARRRVHEVTRRENSNDVGFYVTQYEHSRGLPSR